LDLLNRRKVYDNVIIRIVFPNKMTIQMMDCKPNDTVRSIYKKLDFLINKENIGEGCTRMYYLYDTPPIRRFDSNSTKTLAAEGLAPGAVLHFGLKKIDANDEKSNSKGGSSQQVYPEIARLQYQKELEEKAKLDGKPVSKFVQPGPPLSPEFYLGSEGMKQLPVKPVEKAAISSNGNGYNGSSFAGVKTGNSANSKLLGNNSNGNSNSIGNGNREKSRSPPGKKEKKETLLKDDENNSNSKRDIDGDVKMQM